MKKILAIALVLMLALALISGCGQKTDVGGNGEENGEETTSKSYDDMGIACELTSEEYGIGFRKGSDLTAEVDKYIDELMGNGTLDDLASKYELTLVKNAPANNDAEVSINDLEYIKGNGKMVIGITDFAPMNYQENGKWTGFDTEFAEAVCTMLGVEAEFVEIDWDNKYNALESKVIDCIWNGMTISEEVLKNTSCSKAYVKNAQVVVMKKDSLEKYKTPEDMADLQFAVEAGSAGAEAAEENKFANVTEVGSQADALLEVESGSSDACIIDLTMAYAMTGASK